MDPRLDKQFIMAALWNRAGHYIFVLLFLSSSSSLPAALHEAQRAGI